MVQTAPTFAKFKTSLNMKTH